MRVTTLTVGSTPVNITVRSYVAILTLRLRESKPPTVAGWPTTSFTFQAAAAGDGTVQIQSGEELTLDGPLGSGALLGTLVATTGTTSVDQIELP